ncbi:MAG: hypothetical protein J0M12_08245 [Deltaproteobacteria bacterium]|nr:hypothetical protein [Deltaproteobacteria bacterium]
MSERKHEVSAFYKFVALPKEGITELRERILSAASRLNVCGLMILAEEGCNGTVAAPPESLAEFRSVLRSIPEFSDLEFKNSAAHFKPFRRFKVDIRPEIVTFDGAKLQPGPGTGQRLRPSEWHAMLESEQDLVLIDTRNTYETEIGMFRGALDPKLTKFSEFTEFVKSSEIPKEKKILMYCTGGIRCEKASLEMERLGYQNVFQLDGGILKYLEEYPDGKFDGECFVFDHRVAVDSHLEPSRHFKLCPHCGNPGDRGISCVKCGNSAVICKHCAEQAHRISCSKNCAHYLLTHL